MARSHVISQEAINLVTNTVYGDTKKRWLPDNFITASPTAKPTNTYNIEVEHYCAPVVHPVTGVTITQYRKLANYPVTGFTNTVYGDTKKRWLPDNFITASPTAKPTNSYNIEVEHYCASVVHPVTGVPISQYRKLANDPVAPTYH